MRALVLLLLLVGCDGGTRPSTRALVFADDLDAGVRCYDWAIGESAISCVRVR